MIIRTAKPTRREWLSSATGAVILKIDEANGSLSPEPGSPFHAGTDTAFITTTTGR